MCHPETAAGRGRLRPQHSLRVGPAGFPAPRHGSRYPAAAGFLPHAAGAEGDFDHGIEQALRAMLVSPDFLFRIERDPEGRRAGHELPHQRFRAGVATLLLPLEQHPGRPAARPCRAGQACTIRQCCRRKCGACWTIRKSEALVAISPASGCICATCSCETRSGRLSGVRRGSTQGVPAETDFLPERHAGGSSRDRPAGCQLHLSQPATGGALRDSRAYTARSSARS